MEQRWNRWIDRQRARRPKVELGKQHTKAELETGKPKGDPRSWTEPLKEIPRG